MTDLDIDNEPNTGLRKTLIGGIGGTSLLFLSAFLAGYTVAVFEHGMPSTIDMAMIGGILAVIAAVVFVCVRLWPKTGPEPIGPSAKKSRDLMFVIIGLSIVAGIAFAAMDGPDNNLLFSNGPISLTAAVIVLAGWLIVTPIVTLLWWRSIDEHEAGAYREGSMIAAHFYLFLAPAWWIAGRAGWVPAQDPMIVFIIVCFVWTVAWFYKKFT
ncbi:MAG: hypothetical protein AAGK01_05005 [Pseudomonadota bacterium]